MMSAFTKLASILKGTANRVDKIPGLSTVNMLWINAGHMRWIGGLPTKHFSSLEVLTKSNAEIDGVRPLNKGGKRAPKAWQTKAKMCALGALTLPVGLPLAIVSLPFVFAFSGAPHLRKRHLDGVTNAIKHEFDLCDGSDGNGGSRLCARQIAKLISGIGTPKVEQICDECMKTVK